MKKVLALAIFWRIILSVPIILGFLYLPVRNNYEYTLFYNQLTFQRYSLLSLLFTSFANFDGVHYISIAHFGYTIDAGFFPLLPILIHIFSGILSSLIHIKVYVSLLAVGLFLSTLFFFAGLYVLYFLLKEDYNENIVFQTVLFLLAFPAAFFLVSVYSESLFFFLTVLIFYLLRKQKWYFAGICGLLLTLTRPVGVAILPAILYELFIQQKVPLTQLFTKFMKHKFLWLKGAVVSIITLSGIGMYVVFNFLKWHDALFFIHAQGAFKNNRSVSSFIFFPQTIVRYIKILVSLSPKQYEWSVALLELGSFFFAAVLLYIAWRKKIRMSYLIFSFFAFLIPISTGTFSGLPRYVIVLFPVFLGFALLKNKFIKFLYVVLGTLLLAIFFLFFSQGYFVA